MQDPVGELGRIGRQRLLALVGRLEILQNEVQGDGIVQCMVDVEVQLVTWAVAILVFQAIYSWAPSCTKMVRNRAWCWTTCSHTLAKRAVSRPFDNLMMALFCKLLTSSSLTASM